MNEVESTNQQLTDELTSQPHTEQNPKPNHYVFYFAAGIFVGIAITTCITMFTIAYDTYNKLNDLSNQISNLELQLQYTAPRTDSNTLIKESNNEAGEKEPYDRGYLGAVVHNLSTEAAETYHIPQGVVIYRIIPGSAANKAALKQGDIIVGIDDKSVSTQEELIRYLEDYSVGDKVTIKVHKVGTNTYGYILSDVIVTLQEKPNLARHRNHS